MSNKSTVPGVLIGIGIGVAVVVVGCCGGCLMLSMVRPAARSITGTSPPGPSAPKREASEELQEQRRVVIQKTIDEGVLHKIDYMGGSIPKAYVLPGWYTLTIDQKKTFAGLWCAWAYKLPQGEQLGISDSLVIRDARTGKDIGQISNSGLAIY